MGGLATYDGKVTIDGSEIPGVTRITDQSTGREPKDLSGMSSGGAAEYVMGGVSRYVFRVDANYRTEVGGLSKTDEDSHTVVIQMSRSTGGKTYNGTAFIHSVEDGAEVEGVAMQSFTVTYTGTVTEGVVA